MNWRLVLLPLWIVACGALGTLAGVLASLLVTGAVRYVVWALVGLPVALGTMTVIERRFR